MEVSYPPDAVARARPVADSPADRLRGTDGTDSGDADVPEAG
ncbi:hypothetical protein [Patulibacter minatonensis]|nr:hypothetical protein [Patulibacter minatonensis]